MEFVKKEEHLNIHILCSKNLKGKYGEREREIETYKGAK